MVTSKGARRPALERSDRDPAGGGLGALESFFDTDPAEVPTIDPSANPPVVEVVVADREAEQNGNGEALAGVPPVEWAPRSAATSERGRRRPSTRWRHDPDFLRRVVGALVVVVLAAVCVAVALRVVG
jgi:hypothetical protein